MTEREVSPVLQKVAEFFQSTFPVVRVKKIGVDDRLFDQGVLDSMGMIDVILFMQQEFHVSVDGGDLVVENFGTMRAISEYVEKHLASG